MASNVPAWTKETFGVAMTAEQFRLDPEAQDLVAGYKITKHLKSYSPKQVAAIWFSGQPYLTNVTDAHGTTVLAYANDVVNYYLQDKN